MQDNETGHMVWGLLFSILVCFPISLPRTASQLRYSSMFGVICTIYLDLALAFIFLFNRELVPSPWENIKKMEAFKFSYSGIVSSIPMIIYAYMY